MTQYQDFKGEISVDFEENTTQKNKIKEFFNKDLNERDFIIGIDFSVGEYHHKQKNQPYKALKFYIIDESDLQKNNSERKIKELEVCCENFEQFFSFFKRLELELRPYHHRATH